MKELHTPSEIIDALGGNGPVAELCSTQDKPCTDKVVSNWRRDGFPPRTYRVMQNALLIKGFVAPDHLWKMIPLISADGRAA